MPGTGLHRVAAFVLLAKGKHAAFRQKSQPKLFGFKVLGQSKPRCNDCKSETVATHGPGKPGVASNR